MASNKKIKADNEIEIEASNINLEATTDVTGDLNVSSNLDVTGTINTFTFPSDGINGQVLSTNGSGALSFIDAAAGGGGGADEITSAAEAASYTGTANIIYITATEAITFTTNLRDRIIIFKEYYDLIFQDCDLENCIIQHYDHVIIENTRTDGVADIKVVNCRIQTFGKVEVKDSGNTLGNVIRIKFSSIQCSNFTGVDINTEKVYLSNTTIDCSTFSGAGSISTYHFELSSTLVRAGRVYGKINVKSYSSLTQTNSNVGNLLEIFLDGTAYTTSAEFLIPFTATPESVNANIVAQSHNASPQTCSLSNNYVVFDDTSSSTYIDNTSCLDSNGKFTAKVKGLYHVRATIYVSSAGTSFPFNAVTDATLLINTTAVQTIRPAEMQYDATHITFNLDCILNLDLNDYVRVGLNGTDTSYIVAESGVGNPRSTFSVNKIN